MKPTFASAPTRIDLVGGTLDIWPLNLFFDEPVTLNMAISIRAMAKVTPRKDGVISLSSRDTGASVEFQNRSMIKHNHSLALLSRLVEHFVDDDSGLSVTTFSEAPKGAGLAGSSALNVALSSALARSSSRRISGRGLIDVAKDIEAALLGVPTGLQDYGAAVYGSVNAFHFPPGGMRREKIGGVGKTLEKIILLFYSGQTRNSGINNWEIFTRIVEKEKDTHRKFRKIADYSQQALGALRSGDIDKFVKAVNGEWRVRSSLFPSISTPVIDKAITAGEEAGGIGARICGAGGGGCFFVICDPTDRGKVTAAVTAEGPVHLPYKLSGSGLGYNGRDNLNEVNGA